MARPGLFGERAAVSRVNVPAFKVGGQIGRAIQHAITLKRSGNGQPDAGNPDPKLIHFAREIRVMASTQLCTTASGPLCELVGR